MKQHLLILFSLLALAACTNLTQPWNGQIQQVDVQLMYPAGHADAAHGGVRVQVANIGNGSIYTAVSDSRGTAQVMVPSGLYRISANDRQGRDIYNGTADKVLVNGRTNCQLDLSWSQAGTLVVKELYVGGCSKAPQEGTYQSDQYVLLHNNDTDPVYLDSLCFGTLSPYNATGVNHWLKEDGSFPDFAPVVSVVWKFPGNGRQFPLAPGQDALIALRGAIDHTEQYPLSVNLNRPDCFVCYNPTYFPNPLYHPAPGDLIQQDHILEVVVKTGQSNANVVSVSSPAFLIFKAQGISIEDYVLQADVIQATPGSSTDIVVKVPYEWVIDAVEVFDGSRSNNSKRIIPALDAGFVVQQETFKGRSLIRKIDEELSAANGFTVLQDSNNSSLDFYESDTQSLKQ